MDNLGAIGGPLIALGLVGLIGVGSAILLSIIPGRAGRAGDRLRDPSLPAARFAALDFQEGVSELLVAPHSGDKPCRTSSSSPPPSPHR